MTQEELVALAIKVREGKATQKERELFFSELKKKVDDLSHFLSNLPK